MKEMLYAVRCLKSNEDMILGSYLHLIISYHIPRITAIDTES